MYALIKLRNDFGRSDLITHHINKGESMELNRKTISVYDRGDIIIKFLCAKYIQ